jgi:hypothetical protein
MVLPTFAAKMVLLMLYQALAQLGIYLQKRVQLDLLDLQARKAPRQLLLVQLVQRVQSAQLEMLVQLAQLDQRELLA